MMRRQVEHLLHRGGAGRALERGRADPLCILRSAEVVPDGQRQRNRQQHGAGGVQAGLAAIGAPGGQGDNHDHHRVEQHRRVLGGIRDRHAQPGRAHQRVAQGITVQFDRSHAEPGGHGEQHQRHRVVGCEGAEELRGTQPGEQRDGEKRRGPTEHQPFGHPVQRGGGDEHKDQAEYPGPGQAADVVGQSRQRRVNHRRS
jgi:hypothetical protein